MKRFPSIRNPFTGTIGNGLVVIWISLAVCIGIGAGGCSAFKLNPEKTNTDSLKEALAKSSDPGNDQRSRQAGSATSDQGVRLSGGVSLGDTENLAFTPDELSVVLNELIEAETWNSVRSLIWLYPDIMSKILMRDDPGSISPQRLLKVATLYDEQWGEPGTDSWTGFVQAMNLEATGSDFSQSRSEFLRLLENNEPAKALDLRLSQARHQRLPVIARAEALRLEGVAHMMLEHDRESLVQLANAMSLLQARHPYQASKLALLLGEAQRHAGALVEWKSSWESAIDIQSRLLSQRGLKDPAFWKQAAYLRPASTPWPSDVIGRLEDGLRNENLDFSSTQTIDVEAVVWATIGTQSLKRHEYQNAILALKKSEALVSSKSLKEELQMQQALAMINGGQQGPASAILLRLGSQSTLLGDRAKAILASLKLQNGGLAQGMNLLQSAIKTSSQWPTSERLRAEADYGLAYLMRGREKEGIALLNQVYAEFVERKSYDQAAQCLANIATYYEKTDQSGKHRSALARMKQLELH